MNLPKNYEPQRYETDIYTLWEKSGAFVPTDKGQGSYSIVMPPPNANANLHIGYELTAALEDIAARYNRLQGKATLLLPGADHAGFETQVVYEKHLAKEGKSRFDFSREELYTQIWDFVAGNRSNFENQMRRMGVGCDWGRFTFTLDDKIIKRAYATFKKMWDEGLIYRGERLVNYCTHHRTGFADIEVVHEEAATPLYYIKYGPFTLATTRPETKFGDTAVAVHPDDERYKKYVDTVVTVEGVNGPFEVRVVADEMVDPAFGTGVVKITPAHSFDDWEVAQRHNLPAIRVINHDGTLNHHAGRFEGMTVLEARKAVVAAMEERGLLVKVDADYRNRIGKCYKCGTTIEPMLMEQWFVNMKPLADKALAALRNDEITFYPASKKDQLIGYLENLWDWNLSRQIAWGIPIPAFQNVDDSDDWIYDERVDQEIIEVDGKTYRRDPDVFDTWFSSSSWPYATLGFGESDDFERFYPLSLMETGGEILYPWVSRMIMLGLYVTGKVPFKAVYIHGYVMAEDGSKMSKSIGNVVDPLPVIEQFGSDALRMGIIASRAPAINRGYDARKVEDARNFCNKIWNIARYIEGKVGKTPQSFETDMAHTDADHWILGQLQKATQAMTSHLEAYRFAEAYDTLYHFVWDDFADWYLEASKAQTNPALLAYALENILRLAHPFAPFATETIWQTLGWKQDSILASDTWPMQQQEHDSQRAIAFEALKELITEIRAISKSIGTTDAGLAYHKSQAIAENAALIMQMTRVPKVAEVDDSSGLKLTQTSFDCWLEITPEVARKHNAKLAEQLKAEQASIGRLEGRLGNSSYVANAPEEVVAQTRQQLAEAQQRLAAIKAEQSRFS